MGKKLITKNNYNGFVSQENNKLYVSGSMILSPGVKDILREKGIGIVYGEKPESADGESSSDVVDLESSIVNMLKKDFNIAEGEDMDSIVAKVLKKLDHKGGFIHGK
ncbi:MAG: hypothetical protein MJB12_05070 [Firmicutes bacterium]|nr:hypothetical protein [Bacillota bacterium]